MTQASDREMIGELMQNWGFWRDQGEWDALRTTFHPEGRIRVTWFSGLFTEFVTTSMEMRKRRSGVKHWIGGSKIDINGDRAIAETNVMIMGRPVLHDVLVDSVAYSRFYDLVEKRDGVWRILEREAIYEKDRVDPVVHGTLVPFDLAKLNAFPPAYRHLAYSLGSSGYTVSADLPTDGSEALERLYARGSAWLGSSD